MKRGVLKRFFEQRTLDETSGWGLIQALRNGTLGSLSSAGVAVNHDSAMTFSAVFACVRVLAESESALPLITYRRLPEGGRERAPEHSLYSLLHDAPNDEMTSMSFREALMVNMALWGNGYARMLIDNRGEVREMWPLLSRCMQIKRGANGRLRYEYDAPDLKQAYPTANESILHIPALTLDGFGGMSPIKYHRQAIGLGLAEQEFGARFFGRGANPSLILHHPGVMSESVYARLKKSFEEEYGGLANSHKALLLEEGTTAEKISVPPEDAQFLESRQFQAIEIARIFRMQPHKIGILDNATFSNIEEQSLDFVINTLGAWLVRIEQAISLFGLLPGERSTFYSEHLVDSLLRGNIVARYGAYHSARQDGWLNGNEIRAKENMNPMPDGERYWEPLNVMATDGSTPPAAPGQPASNGQRSISPDLSQAFAEFLSRNHLVPNGITPKANTTNGNGRSEHEKA